MDQSSRKLFDCIWWFLQFLGLLSITLVFIWICTFLGGFGWHERPLHEFNYHPLFSVLAIVSCGNGLLIYRARWKKDKFTLKIAHTILLLLTFIFTVVSLKTVFDSHNYRPIPIANMYSFHSWIGCGAVILLAMQFSLGFLSFLYPRIRIIDQHTLLPYHQFFGITTFVLAIAACHSGIMEKAKSTLKSDYQNLPPAAYVANFLGVSLTLFGIAVVYLASMSRFRCTGVHESEDLHLNGTNGVVQS